MATLRGLASFMAASAALTGCEPSPGKVLDARNVNAGPLELQVRLLAERHWTDQRVVWVTSRNAGASWEVTEGSPPALTCEREPEKRRVLGSH